MPLHTHTLRCAALSGSHTKNGGRAATCRGRTCQDMTLYHPVAATCASHGRASARKGQCGKPAPSSTE